MTTDVVVVGSINADLVLEVDRHPGPGETILGRGGQTLPGGKGANQACAAALLGARTAMIGAVGTDAVAPIALSELERAGVDLTGVTRHEGPTGLAVVTVAASGENSIVVVPGANAECTPDHVRAHAGFISASTVLVLQGEVPMSAVDTAAALARQAGTRVVLNAAPAGDFAHETLRTADPLVVNEHEATQVLAAIDPDAVPGLAADTKAGEVVDHARLTSHALRAAGLISVVITLGASGCVVLEAEPAQEAAHLPARPVRALDTTGAGDAFVGALAAELSRGADLQAAARRATLVSAFSVQRQGAQPSYPTRAQVEAVSAGETSTT